MPARILIDPDALGRMAEAAHARAHDADSSDARGPRAGRAAANRAALPTLGRLAREGVVVLCRSAELGAAGLPPAAQALCGTIPFETIEPALDRGALDTDVFGDGSLPGALQRFCTRLKARHHAFDQLPPEVLERLPATTQRGLADLDRYCGLASRTQGEHLAALFHLWTGELARCDYLLVSDDGLEGFLDGRVRPALRVPLACNPVEPDALLAKLGIDARDAAPGHAGSVVSLFPGGAPGRRHPP